MPSTPACSTLLPLLAALAGCLGLFEPEPQPDGDSCDVGEDCESGTCIGGMCVGSSCSDRSRCEVGFTCSDPGTLAEVFTLGLASGSCVPTCDACPLENPRWSCSDNACGYDGNPHVDAGGPYEAVLGEPVRLVGSAELAPDREVERAHWSSWRDGELGDGLEIEAVFMTPGAQEITLAVEDDEYGYGSATAQVTVCSPEGAPCFYDQDCCGQGELACNVDPAGASSSCGAPPG
jgi:hypothetical protein